MSDYKAMLASVREEEIEELSMMATYIVETHLESYYGRRQKEYMLETTQSAEAIRTAMEQGDHYYWIDSVPAGEGDSVLGMLDVSGFLSVGKEDGKIVIKNIYIMEEIRGRHLVRECMELLTQDEAFQDSEEIIIYIPEGYVQAISVFEHIGFEKSGKTEIPVGPKYQLHCVELARKIVR